MQPSWRDRFILRCGWTAKNRMYPEAAIAAVVGTAWAIADKHLLSGPPPPAFNDN